MASTEGVTEQQQFATGATRSGNAEKKLDYEGFVNPRVEAIFAEYMHEKRVQRDGTVRASDNWQKGIPIASYVKSFVRHSMEFRQMWRGRPVFNVDTTDDFVLRDVLCALRFNIDGLIYELDKRDMVYKRFVDERDRLAFEHEAGF